MLLLFLSVPDDPALSTFGSHFICLLGFLFGPKTMEASKVVLSKKNQQSPYQAASHTSRFLLFPRVSGLYHAKPCCPTLHLLLPLVLPGLVLNLA